MPPKGTVVGQDEYELIKSLTEALAASWKKYWGTCQLLESRIVTILGCTLEYFLEKKWDCRKAGSLTKGKSFSRNFKARTIYILPLESIHLYPLWDKL